ncbi:MULTISPECIES: glycosyltransferase [Rhodoplanes]|nr:glycosyltransferase [Rhodoplanes serenus]
MAFGAREGRDPGPQFDMRGYLGSRPELATGTINPLAQFLRTHGTEGSIADRLYDAWVTAYDTLGEADRAVFRDAVEHLTVRPEITVIVPAAGDEAAAIERTLDSLVRQFYPHWELRVAVPAACNADVVAMAARRGEPRLRIITASDANVANLANAALAATEAPFVLRLAPGDVLSEHALYWLVDALAQNPDADLVYADEDRIDAAGHRHDSHFKPDWNPALLLAHDYVGRPVLYRRTLIEVVGGFRSGLVEHADHDLLLRCSEHTTPSRIHHVPRVLCHRGAEEHGADPVWEIGARVVAEHLERRGITADVRPGPGGAYQVAYRSRAPLPRVSIVMPSGCKLHLVEPCLRHLLERTTYPDYEVLLVVNEIRHWVPEQARFLATLRHDPRVRVLTYPDRPFNFSWINNWAMGQAEGSVVCLMNDDIEVTTPDWLERFVARLRLDGVGGVGPMLYYPNDTVQQAGVVLGLGGLAAHAFVGLPRGEAGYRGRAALEQDLSCVTAACLALRREVIDAVGGFDETLAIAFNDVDLCIRVREAGWRILWTPDVWFYHHESATIGPHNADRQQDFDREARQVRERWAAVLSHDPAYNPNLSITSQHFAPAFPPRIARLPTMC